MNSQIIGILLVLRPWLGTKLESWMKAIRLLIWSNCSQGVQFSPYLLIPASTRSSPQQRSTLLACSPSLSGSNDRSPAAAASQRQNASLCAVRHRPVFLCSWWKKAVTLQSERTRHAFCNDAITWISKVRSDILALYCCFQCSSFVWIFSQLCFCRMKK